MRPRTRRPHVLAAAGSALLLSTAAALGSAGSAAAQSTPAAPSWPAGTNLLANPDAEYGDASTSGYDSVTVPGWQATGAPTMISYSSADAELPNSATPGPADRGGAYFGGGKVATTALTQVVDVSAAATAVDGGGAAYTLAGWLGGYKNDASAAQVNVTFLDGYGGVLGAGGQIGPVTAKDRGDVTEFLQRTTTGSVPAGTRSLKVVITFTDAYVSGDYNNAFADDLSLSLSAPGPAPAPIAVPKSTVGALDHVFVIYMENHGRADIIGNTAQAPYINSLAARYAQASNYFAVDHPSDPNYLALAGGQTYGLLTNCATTCVQPGTNIGDLVEQAGKTWRGYEQSMPTPCYMNHKGYYYIDDLPFVYYSDIVDDPARCASHLVPQSQLAADLTSAATTPNFAWIAADDYYDMEAGGIAAGDGWLGSTIPGILASPAWTDERSAIVIAWDEDAYGTGGTNQGNNVATLVLGSPRSGIKTGGYTSSANYTHYSLLRTVEDALGLARMTKNDEYAAPMNEFWG